MRGSIDEARSLRVAAIGCRLAAPRLPVKGVQRVEGIPQLPGKTAHRRRLLLTDLMFKDVLSCSDVLHDDPTGDLAPGGQAMDLMHGETPAPFSSEQRLNSIRKSEFAVELVGVLPDRRRVQGIRIIHAGETHRLLHLDIAAFGRMFALS